MSYGSMIWEGKCASREIRGREKRIETKGGVEKERKEGKTEMRGGVERRGEILDIMHSDCSQYLTPCQCLYDSVLLC